MEDVHSYLSAGSAVVLGAIIAGLYTSYLNHLTSKNDIIKDYLSDLNVIEKLCAAYWLFEGTTPEAKAMHDKIGHELRAKIEATSSFAELSKSILGEQFSKYEALDVQLFMKATGGSFQTASFVKSAQTYSEAMFIISEIRFLLRSKRNAMFWTR